MILQKLLRFFTGTAIFEFFNTPLSTDAGYIPCYKNHFEWDTIFLLQILMIHCQSHLIDLQSFEFLFYMMLITKVNQTTVTAFCEN